MTGQTSTNLRFHFGKNWKSFSRARTASALDEMQASIQKILPGRDLRNRRVLDVGCGSGLASAAFTNLGAKVEAFDVDQESVDCSKALREQLGRNREQWGVRRGSILDDAFVFSLGRFDLVYAWGVLHHTGALWRACSSVSRLVGPGGLIIVAIYNDQKLISRYWKIVKYLYNAQPICRPLLVMFHLPYLFAGRLLVRAIKSRGRPGRGMNYWHDMIDWLGGYPFEVASPEEVVGFFGNEGFELLTQTLCGRRHGCNEFIFRSSENA